MKMTELRVSPRSAYSPIGENNPLVATVKLQSEKTTVECVLSDETARKMLDLCAVEIAENSRKNVDDFVAAVSAIEGDKSKVLLGNA